MTTKNTTKEDVLRFIATASASDIAAIKDATRGRDNALGNESLRAIKRGDTVEIGGNISPRYMVGMTGTVVSKTRTKIKVELTESVGRFPAGVPIGIPAACVTKVAS